MSISEQSCKKKWLLKYTQQVNKAQIKEPTKQANAPMLTKENRDYILTVRKTTSLDSSAVYDVT